MQDIRTALSKLLGRVKPVSKTAPAAATLKNKMLKALGAKSEPKVYNIMVRGADGNLVSRPATRAEMLEYCNPESVWRRIG